MYHLVTDSPLFSNPEGFYRQPTTEEEIRLRASAQQAMEAGRPMTMAEMYGRPLQLFRALNGFGDDTSFWNLSTILGIIVGGVVVIGLVMKLKG